MEEIKVGDIVRVTNWGMQFSTNIPWFNEHKVELNLDWIVRYAYSDSIHYEGHQYDDKNEYQVLFVDTRCRKALITGNTDYAKVYLVDTSALELYGTSTEMTVSEIEEKLGIKNLKIIKE